MKKVAVITDTSFILTDELRKNKNLKVIPLPLILPNKKEIHWDREISDKKFNEIIKNEIVKTSQSPIGKVEKCWDKYLKEYDILIIAGISKGLSGSYNNTLQLSKKDKYKNKVIVIDTESVSLLLEKIIIKILKYIEENKIKNIEDLKPLIEDIKDSRNKFKCLICPKSLDALKRGGRISPAAAKLGNLLKIKPILILKNGIIDKYGIMRSYTKGIKKELIKLHNNKSYSDDEIYFLHSEFSDENTIKKIIKIISATGFTNITIRKIPKVILAHLGGEVCSLIVYKKSELN